MARSFPSLIKLSVILLIAALNARAYAADHPGSPNIAPDLSVADRYYREGDWDKAIAAATLVLKSYSGNDAVDGTRLSAIRIALLASFSAGYQAGTEKLLTQELDLSERAIRSQRGLLDLAQIDQLFDFLRVDESIVYTLTVAHPDDQELATLAFRYAEARKGRRTREALMAASMTSTTFAQADATLPERLRAATARLADVARFNTGDDRADIEAHVAKIREAEADITALQNSVPRAVRSVEGMMPNSEDLHFDAGAMRLLSSLSLGKVLVIYVKFDKITKGDHVLPASIGENYLALVARVGVPIAVVDLGPARAIDADAKRFLRAVSVKSGNYMASGQALYRDLVQPVAPHFAYAGIVFSHQRVYISPDGELFTIPFNAIPDGQSFLIDEYDIALIDTPLDALPSSLHMSLSPASSFLAFADPDLKWRASPVATARYGALDPPGPPEPLPSAKVEADQIASLWPQSDAVVVAGDQATRGRFFAQARDAGILHIATHGEISADPVKRTTDRRELRSTYSTVKTMSVSVTALARVAVLLGTEAGNQADGADATSTGFVSALEVAEMDFKKTQLVVLSACDSATGDFERGDGVFGLRRAFLQAGAEAVVGSLWTVDSPVTRELMVMFYRNLVQGQDKERALASAERSIRRIHPEPYYWAPFVLSGTSSPLRLDVGAAARR
ncbi:Tetratricopeptide domain-containing protein [Burkholderia pseudomallei]|uniref:CHAT domain-containing protein n=1 Tax=Burkholderia pseudomallei TaxID=28450 RepID=UPI0005DFD68C|nr:CHAT domain-containing protein [Burkholderia pseudomallei]CAJ3501542.1 Tetratricopeptide domain-containing protein [Burkholderia pseudomallei]CAJ3567406.1 Tetratricopeptide domain-containing protein [Burkholderia pseudomallei]CAJ5300042.1 Tetratricopeptide domain-containing protein [Burkholderia pseudomallei]CAJ5323012.1 Tetratricopeptide domain-containing protein [Burkholderia pseudomallei]CAJ5339107.1 Tetratricopeptide domain-containing protein [Burkholderia pseudomallei]